jgi:hypothetical protein
LTRAFIIYGKSNQDALTLLSSIAKGIPTWQ